jgi:hypothetical protein
VRKALNPNFSFTQLYKVEGFPIKLLLLFFFKKKKKKKRKGKSNVVVNYPKALRRQLFPNYCFWKIKGEWSMVCSFYLFA